MADPKYEAIWQAVRKIPFGRVASYGQIATSAGLDGHARMVGYALHALKPQNDVPWHRIVNAQGKISQIGPSARRQQARLEAEGIKFLPSGKIDMHRYGVSHKGTKTLG
jgi:methylated-DNA-protein-cysteine methyltransferase related protein